MLLVVVYIKKTTELLMQFCSFLFYLGSIYLRLLIVELNQLLELGVFLRLRFS